MLHLFKLIGKCYFFFIFIWGHIVQAIPTQEEALKKLREYGVNSDVISKISNIKMDLYPITEISDIKTDPFAISEIFDIEVDLCDFNEISQIKLSHRNIRCWLDIDRFIFQCPETDKCTKLGECTKLDIYYHWLVVGLRQLNPLIKGEYAYIEQALKRADGIYKRLPLEEISDFGFKLAELKFIYLFGSDAYTDFFKIYAQKKIEEPKDCFQGNTYTLIKSWSNDDPKNLLTIFDKVLSDIYLRCEDEILSTELMFYWIGFAMHSVTQNSYALNGKINAALDELACTENLLQEKIGCSIEKLRKMLRDIQTITLQKNRRVRFSEDVFEAPRIRSMGSAPLPRPTVSKGQLRPCIKMAKQPQTF